MTTSQSRKIRDPVASNTDLAGSIVSKQARQKRTKDGTLDLNGSRRNLRTRMGLGITKDPTSRFLTAQPAYARSQSGRNDLQGGSYTVVSGYQEFCDQMVTGTGKQNGQLFMVFITFKSPCRDYNLNLSCANNVCTDSEFTVTLKSECLNLI